MTARLAGAQTRPAAFTAQTPDAGCALLSEPQGIPAALDAAIHRARADKDRDCMKALLIPEARMIFVSLGTGGAPSYKLETSDDWIARVATLGPWLVWSKSQLAGFSLIAGILEPSKCKY